MSSSTSLRCTVKKPQPALETNKDSHAPTITTSHQVMFPIMKMDMTTVEGRKLEKSEEHEEINVAYTDRNMEHRKEEFKKKLVTTSHQVCDMDTVKTAVKRPGSVLEANETPHTFRTSPLEKSPQLPENADPSPIILAVRSLNPTKLKLTSVQDQDDLTATMAPQYMEKVHKGDSSDYEPKMEKNPSYKLEMMMGSARKRKHEVLAENEEINELPTVRDTTMDTSAHGDSALSDNDEYEPRGQQTSLDDVPPLTTQVQTCHHIIDMEDAKMTSCPHKMNLEAEHSAQIITQTPEAPEAHNKKENRSLGGQTETNQNTSDDRNKRLNLPKGRNDKEDSVPNENRPSADDDKSEDNDKAAPKDHDMRRCDYRHRKELNEGVDDAKKHDEERTQPISPSTPMSQDHYSSHSNSVCSYPATSSMEITCPPTGRNLAHVKANTPRGGTTTLWDEDDHLREKLVTEMDLLQQQAIMDKKQIREEIFEMKNRIMWLEDRAMKQPVGSPENEETLSTPTSSQGHQRVFLQPPADSNNIKFPNPVPSQQTVWEIWSRSRQEQLHPTSASVPDDSDLLWGNSFSTDGS